MSEINPDLGYYRAQVSEAWIASAKSGTPYLEVRATTYERSIHPEEAKGPFKPLAPDKKQTFTASQPLSAKTLGGKSLPNLLKALGYSGDVQSFINEPEVIYKGGTSDPAGRK